MSGITRLWWILPVLFIALFPPTLGGMSTYRCGILVFVGIYVILAISLDLLMGYAGQISVGHAAFFAVGAYTTGILTTRLGVPPLLALVAGAFLAAARLEQPVDDVEERRLPRSVRTD